MLKLERMTIDEINSKPFLINHILDLYDEIDGEYFKYQFNGTERYLYRSNENYTIMVTEEEYLLYTEFCLNDDYVPNYIDMVEFCASYMNGQLWTWQKDSEIIENIEVVERPAELNVDGYSGIIKYSQIDLQTNNKIVISYRNQYREDQKIFSCNLSSPFVFLFIDEKSKLDGYMLFQTDYERFSYDLLTIKEYGLSAFLENGAYNLQKERTIERYFKIKGRLPDGTCLLMVPFARQFTKEEMFDYVVEKGFKKDVPDYLIDFHNKNYEECNEILELAEAMKKFDLENKEKLILKQN